MNVPVYFELCVIAGKDEVRLGEIDIRNVMNDGKLFNHEID
jgi:hypothetical protein